MKSTTSKADLGRLAGGAAGLGWKDWAGAGPGSWKVSAGREGGGAGLLANAGWMFCCGAKFWKLGAAFLGCSGCLKGIGCALDGAAGAGLEGAALGGACLKGACLGGDGLDGAEFPPLAGKLAKPPEEDWDLGGEGFEGAAFLIGDCSLVLVG